MRSRYSAFVRGDLDHIGRTSAGEAALAFDRAGLERSLPGTEWLGLEILDVEGGGAGDSVGFVTFRVRFREEGRLHSQTERSEFRRVGGDWRYWRGEADVAKLPVSLARTGRNDPCPCGSGKKYKKCCGA
jgi:SEC-C motif-containing protein